MYIKRTALFSAFILALACSAVAMQFSLAKFTETEQPVLLDYAAFASEQVGMIRAEIYYQVYNDALVFYGEDNGRYKAEFEEAVLVYKNDHEVASYKKEKVVRVVSEQDTKSRVDYRINQVNFDLPPGKYKVVFLLSDKKSQAIVRRELKVKLHDFFQKNPRLSDIELIQATQRATEKGSRFDKGNITIIPSLTRRYTSNDSGRFLFYFEIYSGKKSSQHITVETMLRHNRKGMMYRDTLDVTLANPITRQIRDISTSDLVPGDYELYVRLRGHRFKKIAEKKISFTIAWSQEAALNLSYKTTLDQLEYIAKPGEIKPLRKIKDPVEQRRAINDFWKAHDPDPSTKLNELKVVFYHRIDIANRLFTAFYYDGWQSDRGRIYILYGEPDQIDDYPFVADSPPYQQWHYYRSGRYRKFTFVDKNEDGDYRLIYPYDGLNQRPDF